MGCRSKTQCCLVSESFLGVHVWVSLSCFLLDGFVVFSQQIQTHCDVHMTGSTSDGQGSRCWCIEVGVLWSLLLSSVVVLVVVLFLPFLLPCFFYLSSFSFSSSFPHMSFPNSSCITLRCFICRLPNKSGGQEVRVSANPRISWNNWGTIPLH